MRRFAGPAIAVVVAAAFVGLLVFGVLDQGADASLDDAIAHGKRPAAPAADQKLPLLAGGGTRTLASLRGKVVVVNVFASWCGPCKTESPLLEREQQRLAAHGATVLGVAWKDTTSDAADFVRRYKLSYPVVRDVDGKFARAYGASGIPETFVIDRSGRVTALRRAQVDAKFLRTALSPLVGA